MSLLPPAGSVYSSRAKIELRLMKNKLPPMARCILGLATTKHGIAAVPRSLRGRSTRPNRGNRPCHLGAVNFNLSSFKCIIEAMSPGLHPQVSLHSFFPTANSHKVADRVATPGSSLFFSRGTLYPHTICLVCRLAPAFNSIYSSIE